MIAGIDIPLLTQSSDLTSCSAGQLAENGIAETESFAFPEKLGSPVSGEGGLVLGQCGELVQKPGVDLSRVVERFKSLVRHLAVFDRIA